MGNETTFPTKEELVTGYNLRELFKQKMIEELQKTQGKDTTEEEVELAEAYRKVSRELKKLSLKEGN